MEYNLAEKSYIESNMVVGNVDLTYQQINTLVTSTVENIRYLFGDDILCIDTDLGHRVATSEIKYYFTSSLPVMSGIDFYYKNDEQDNYIPLTTFINDGVYYTTVSGSVAPRYIRLTHTVSGTAVSGTVNGFEILNDDSIINFGEEGDLIQKNIITTVDTGDEITLIPIYNNGTLTSTAYVSLELQKTDVDNGISISNTGSGPWVASLDSDVEFISAAKLDQGNYIVNTQNLNGELALVSTSVSGIFESRIINIPYTPFNYLNLVETTVTGTNARVCVDVNDPVSTMEVRSSNVKPLDFAQFREITYRYDGASPYRFYIRYKDRYIETENLYSESADLVSVDYGFDSSERVYRQYVDIDPKLSNNFAFIVHYWPLNVSTNEPYTGDQRQHLIVGKRINGVFKYVKFVGSSSSTGRALFSTDFRFVRLDKNGGVWFYFYYNRSDTGYTYDNISKGYHLMYYNNNFSRTLYIQETSTDFIHRISLDYENDHIWYEDITSNSVIKLDNTNTILASYSSEINGLNGIAALPDGGCWFVNNTNLVRLDSNGIKIDEVETDIVGIIDIEIDGTDALWVANVEGIRRIFTDGREHFFVSLNTIYTIKVTDSGLWVQCTDDTITYIKKDLQGVYKVLDKYRGMVGGMNIEVGGDYNGELFPTFSDTYWNDLEWNKVAVEGYMLPEDYYHQVRLTLWPDSSTTPKVSKLQVAKNTVLEDISPINSKNIYLKINVNDVPRGQSYDSSLRVGWSLPLV